MKAWKSTIPACDLDKHMAATKQVQANAKVIQQMFNDFPIKKLAKILVPGCGTGQIFDFFSLNLFSDCYVTFTDINTEYLEYLHQRLKKIEKVSYKVLEDDIEETKIQEEFATCLLVLVLEHVDWQRTVQNITNFAVESIYVIIQKQDKDKHVVSAYEDMPQSIIKFSKIAKTHVIDEYELERHLKQKGFDLLKKYSEKVIDYKEMLGMYFYKSKIY